MLGSTRTAIGLTLIALASAAHCQPSAVPRTPEAVAPATTHFEPVTVVGYRHPARVSYARLRDGLAAFHDKRGLAPEGVLLFEARDTSESQRPLRLHLEIGDRAIPIRIDRMGRFSLPAIDDAQAGGGELVANRRAGQLRITPLVLSPGTTAETRRLGDLRLQCEVGWAMDGRDASLLVRIADGLGDGACRSAHIAVGFSVSQRLRDVELSLGERTGKVRFASPDAKYWPPLHEDSWSDEARLVLTPAASAPIAALAAAARTH